MSPECLRSGFSGTLRPMQEQAREFRVERLGWKEIHELPDGWPPARLQALLSSLEVDDVADEDALEMTVMALQDREVDEASDLVLQAVFGDDMRPGVRQNLVPDLREDRPWEEFAEIARQAGIFEAVVLLQRAFPRDFGVPDAVSLAVRIETGSETARAWLDAASPDPGLLLRILAAGMDDRALLRRLYAESLASRRFPDAGSILWHVARSDAGSGAGEFALVSSHAWFEPLSGREGFAAQAWPDAPADGAAPGG